MKYSACSSFSQSSCLSPCGLQKVSLEFYIDVHAHSTMMNGFMYGNVYEEEERVQRQAVFPRLLCQNAPDFSLVSLMGITMVLLVCKTQRRPSKCWSVLVICTIYFLDFMIHMCTCSLHKHLGLKGWVIQK